MRPLQQVGWCIRHIKRRGENMAAGGRPKAKLKYDIEIVQDLASIFCSIEEIASILGISRRTLERDERFCELYKTGLDMAKSSLRRAQWKSVQNGSVPMQIWLGKQYLNQTERVVLDDKDDLIKNVEDTLIKVREIAKNVTEQ